VTSEPERFNPCTALSKAFWAVLGGAELFVRTLINPDEIQQINQRGTQGNTRMAGFGNGGRPSGGGGGGGGGGGFSGRGPQPGRPNIRGINHNYMAPRGGGG
jgi:hypothetical protein